jgi:hypothetical protein
MMRNRKIGGRFALASLLIAGAALPGCDSDPVGAETGLTPEVAQALERAIQDEYKAETVYLRVLADHGDVVPFSNIVNAEERHSQSLAAVFVRHDLAVPLSEWNLNNVPRFDTVQEACAAGVQAEIENIDLYDELFALPLPADVATVFQNNRAASLNRHLPAFQACS